MRIFLDVICKDQGVSVKRCGTLTAQTRTIAPPARKSNVLGGSAVGGNARTAAIPRLPPTRLLLTAQTFLSGAAISGMKTIKGRMRCRNLVFPALALTMIGLCNVFWPR